MGKPGRQATGRLACHKPIRSALLVLILLLAGCTAQPDDPPAGQPEQTGEDKAGCGPLNYDEVRGRPPRHVADKTLARFPNDHAVCAGLWLRTGRGFVPQGVVVDGRTAWVSGFDGNARVGSRFCRVERVDLRTGRRLAALDPVSGQVGDRPTVGCRHGGGLALDEHGLWLVETTRLWLIDPESMEVDRVWALLPPLRGSFALVDDDGRLGVGRWYPQHTAQVDWFDTDALAASSVVDLTPELAADSTPAPSATQGAVWAALAGRPAAPWFARSVTRCGILVGADSARRRGFVPGAEGMDLVGEDTLWVVSESGTRHYQDQGGRPVVPQLLRLDLSDFASWRGPDCRV